MGMKLMYNLMQPEEAKKLKELQQNDNKDEEGYSQPKAFMAKVQQGQPLTMKFKAIESAPNEMGIVPKRHVLDLQNNIILKIHHKAKILEMNTI